MKPLRCLLQRPVTVCGQAYLSLQGQGGHALNAALNTTYLPLSLILKYAPPPLNEKKTGSILQDEQNRALFLQGAKLQA